MWLESFSPTLSTEVTLMYKNTVMGRCFSWLFPITVCFCLFSSSPLPQLTTISSLQKVWKSQQRMEWAVNLSGRMWMKSRNSISVHYCAAGIRVASSNVRHGIGSSPRRAVSLESTRPEAQLRTETCVRWPGPFVFFNKVDLGDRSANLSYYNSVSPIFWKETKQKLVYRLLFLPYFYPALCLLFNNIDFPK